MALNDGDVVRFDYTLLVDGKTLETSTEEGAKAAGMHEEGRQYNPLTVTIGARQIIQGLEKVLVSKAKAGAEFEAEIKAIDGYGERQVSLVKDVPMAVFKKQKVVPRPGMVVNHDNQRAVVTRVAGGRVRLDMNHDLAGMDLTYKITVKEILDDEEGKLGATLDNLFPNGGYQVENTDKVVRLEIPDQAKFDQQWPMHKFRVVSALRAVTGMDKDVQLIETFPAMPAAPAEAEHVHDENCSHEEE
jgi:peptidylprolyl isomerase